MSLKTIAITFTCVMMSMSISAQNLSGNHNDTITREVLSTDSALVKKDTVVIEATTGTAKALVRNHEVEVGWVQLWKGGPKFATRNVGATGPNDKESSKGTPVVYKEAVKMDSAYVWGANWRTPVKEEMLLLTVDGKVSHTLCQQDGVWGFMFTGLDDGYTENSIFIPSDSGDDSMANIYIWSASITNSIAWSLCLDHSFGHCYCIWYNDRQNLSYYIRPVLSE